MNTFRIQQLVWLWSTVQLWITCKKCLPKTSGAFLFLFGNNTCHICLNSRYCCPYCWLPMEKVSAGSTCGYNCTNNIMPEIIIFSFTHYNNVRQYCGISILRTYLSCDTLFIKVSAKTFRIFISTVSDHGKDCGILGVGCYGIMSWKLFLV